MRVLVTGVGGLVGSAFAELAHARGHEVVGVESNARAGWFGWAASVDWRVAELRHLGVRVVWGDFRRHLGLVRGVDAVVHCAGQPSHEFSLGHAVEDFDINAVATISLLEAVRHHAPEAAFVFLGTNKVYGDRVNSMNYFVEDTRLQPDPFSFSAGVSAHGVNEDFPLDASLHTPFGVSKLAADLMVQEYSRSFGLKTACFRCGCITGRSGSAAELHGFLGYLVKRAVAGMMYRVYGHQGRQVRDNLAAEDLAEAILAWLARPVSGVYNMGGGPGNSVSVREAVNYLREDKGLGFAVDWTGPPRLGDHVWWITDTSRFESVYTEWKRTRSVQEMLDEMVRCEQGRRGAEGGFEAVAAGIEPEAGV